MLNKLEKLHTNHDSVHHIPQDNFFQFFKKLNKADDKNSKFHEFVIEVSIIKRKARKRNI
jgi:hypothetical protein